MFGPWREGWDWLRGRHPNSFIKKPHLNFMTLHYVYIIALSIIGSIMIYPVRTIRYIDALFFASGAATQSGLNTVDVNLLKTEQQVVIYILTMIANPIFINTFVVFVRLHWFRRRFKRVVREARNFRRTRSRVRTESLDARDADLEERGVNGRNIVVLRSEKENGHASPSIGRHPTFRQRPEGEANDLSPTGHDGEHTMQRNITFADEIKPTPHQDTDLRVPEQRSAEHHIAFLENQRNPKDKGALRIPGPREFDRGDLPQTVENEEDRDDLSKHVSPSAEPRSPVEGPSESSESNAKESDGVEEEHSVKRNITIDEPEPPSGRLNRLAKLRSRKSTLLQHATTLDTAFTSGLNRLRSRATTFTSVKSAQSKDPMPYLSWQPTIGRNSAFVDLTEEQRDELGGIEYRSLKTLATILLCYFIGFHLLGVICLVPWIKRSGRYGGVVDADGQNRVWWGIFTPASLFNDLGITLTPDSMISFQDAILPLLFGSFLIVIGNTGFPCMLRFVIWFLSRIVPVDSATWEELRFLLDHPRRCFTLLFPSSATWWLFWILVVLNATDLIFFIILDLNDPTVTSLSAGIRVLDGWFQAASTRTAGFSCVNLADLHPAIQVSYLIMMYISVFPIAISLRRTNVYEEKSLGVYGNPEDDSDNQEPSYIGTHLRKQLSFDLWYIFLGFFIITIVEGGQLENSKEIAFTTFSVLFEIVSAYGTVGLSLGYPNKDASFSSQFGVISKLVIIAMQIRGRHRGLPYSVDRAILLPSESLHQKEDRDARIRQRRNSNISSMSVDRRLSASMTNPPDLKPTSSGVPSSTPAAAPTTSSGMPGRHKTSFPPTPTTPGFSRNGPGHARHQSFGAMHSPSSPTGVSRPALWQPPSAPAATTSNIPTPSSREKAE